MKKYVALLFVITIFSTTLAVSRESRLGVYRDVDKHHQRISMVVGVDVYLYLFNSKVYKERVLPSYLSFIEKDDPERLIGLLKECIQRLDANPRLSEMLLWDKDSCEEDIGILTGTVHYSPDDGHSSNQGEGKQALTVRKHYAQGLLSSRILQVLCVPYDRHVEPEQNMGRAQLVPYLYEHSKWIEELFTFSRTVRGGRLELTIGESTEIFTKQDILEFKTNLVKIPKPQDPELRKDFENLNAVLFDYDSQKLALVQHQQIPMLATSREFSLNGLACL